MSILGKFRKQPGEILDYDILYADFFSTRTDNLASATVTVEDGITLVEYIISGNLVNIVLSDGVDGVRYKITIKMTTTAGILKEDEFFVTIKEI